MLGEQDPDDSEDDSDNQSESEDESKSLGEEDSVSNLTVTDSHPSYTTMSPQK